MTMTRICLAVVMICAPITAWAQDAALEARVMTAVRAALAPALPFPASDELGSVPADGKARDPWMVKPLQPGDRMIEVLANPLNEAHQRRAAKAMAEIGESIEAAQRRADVQYERAIAEARRTGRSQDVDGVTLSDEGLAGARIDAESHVTIDVLFNQPSYRFEVASSIEPGASFLSKLVMIPAVTGVYVPANTYREPVTDVDRFCETQALIFLGAVTAPDTRKRPGSAVFEVTANATPLSDNAKPVSAVVIHMRGNDTLIAELLRKSEWSRILELLK